jgi:NAD+ kinase
MDSIGVIANLNRSGAQQVVERLAKWCDEHDTPLYFCQEMTSVSGESRNVVQRCDLPELCDVILSMGGDGTLLATARLVGDSGVPILGINIGSLGFLTEQTPVDLERTLQRLSEGGYHLQERMVLAASVSTADGKTSFALNDVVIARSDIRMASIALYSNGDYICSYNADGLVISTPTGSTAYSLAVGGPILNPEMDAIVASPIAPHSLASRPLVFNANEALTVEISPDTEVAVMIVDGQESTKLKNGDRISIEKANYRVRLIRFDENSFYKVLREKLHWGYLPIQDSTRIV